MCRSIAFGGRAAYGKVKKLLYLPFLAALLAPPAAGGENFIAGPESSGKRFLLLDRDDPAHIFRTDEAPPSGSGSLLDGDLPLSDYSSDSWNKVRRDIEEGRFNQYELKPRTEVEISTDIPLSLPPEVEFTDSGTSLSVTGRKLITLNYTGKRFLNEQKTVTRPKSLSLFEINQQMQVRMQGKVGTKITVNVDYDDTKQDKQDISVVYRGAGDEVVQNVSFGDIDLSLPASEFVSYNKQLFGIRADLKTKALKFTFVGSRTKGQTKTKQFTGNTQFQTTDLLDINYLRRKYYDIAFGNVSRLPIKAGSERIYIDQQTQAMADGVTIFKMSANDLAVQTSTYTGRFQIMNSGIDYVVDYVKGLVTFNRTLNPQDVVIIDYRNQNDTLLSQNTSSTTLDTGGSGLYKLIKTQNDIQLSSAGEAGFNRELKTYYSIGRSNLVRDDGRGIFTLKVQDLNRNEVLPTVTNNMPKYPDTIDVDFEQGIFNLKQVFTLDGAPKDAPDPQLYSASPVSKRVIRVEYSYRFKTFMLEPSIVPQSEVVLVDGKKIARNEEYFIDYDSGFITFYYPERVKQDSKIDITYEVSPFGGIGNQSLVGGRVSYDLSKHFSLGSTLLYQGGIKSNTVPNITDLANSMLVYEGDVQVKSLNLLGLRTNLSGELAQSRLNPNLNDFALVDNMEGVKQDDSAPLDANYWRIAANPAGSLYGPADPRALQRSDGSQGWYSENIPANVINPASTSEGTQQVLSVNYDFNVSSEVSIVYPLSATGLDFSQKTALELVINGDNAAGPKFNIHLGQINEDADGAGGQSFVCSNGLTLTHAPKSEDKNCDGQIAPDEDIGWEYAPAGKTSKFYGIGNGRLDSEDLNQNGRLDPQDFTGGDFGYINNSEFTDTTDSQQKNAINFTGWHTLYAPISIASTDTYKWNAVKQVRISLTQTPGGAATGIIKFARISAVGNTWGVNQSATTGSLKALAENNIDNPGYVPIYEAGGEATKVFNDLYGSVSEQKNKNNSGNLVEQTLSLDYTALTSSSTAYVYRKFTRPVDISQHAKFRFLLKPAASYTGASFFIRIGDDNNYFKAEIPLDFNDWRLYTIGQEDLTGDNIPDIWTNGSNHTIYVSSKGAPSLQQVAQLTMGVTPTGAGSHDGKVYVNEIHLAEPIGRTGNARKVEGSFEIPGWLSFGGKHRYMDRNFQTPVTVIANQDSELQSGYLNITRLSFLPLNFTAAKQITTTPNALVTGGNNLVNSLQQGKVKKFNGSAASSLNIGRLPKLGVNYGKSRTNYLLMARQDDLDTYAANLAYTLPLNLHILPQTYNFNYSLGRNRVDYDESKLLDLAGLYNTEERTDSYGAKLTFAPWKGSSFNPGYTLQQVREKRLALTNRDAIERYPKSMQQTVNVNSNFMFFSWLNPSVNYSITTIENNNLNITTVTVVQSSTVFSAGEIKTVNRNAQGAVSLTLNMNSLMPRSRLLRSLILSSNYQIQDGDSWTNIEKAYDTRNKLWLRDSLRPEGRFASRNSVTLRDTISSSQRWQPFEGFGFKGRAAALGAMSLTNNFSNSVQKSEVTGTRSQSVNRTFPDLILSLSKLETLTRTAKWAQNANLNLKYTVNFNESKAISLDTSKTYGMDLRFKLLNYVDTAMSYNLRLAGKKDLRLNQRVQNSVHRDATLQGTFDYRKFHFTPKIDYVSDLAKGGLGVVTQNTTAITPSVLIKSDFRLPKGLKLPFMKSTIIFTNRIVWTTTLSYALRKSPVTVAENTRLFSLNSSADYEAAKNLRLAFNAGLQRLWNKYLKQDDYFSYQFGSTLTFQF